MTDEIAQHLECEKSELLSSSQLRRERFSPATLFCSNIYFTFQFIDKRCQSFCPPEHVYVLAYFGEDVEGLEDVDNIIDPSLLNTKLFDYGFDINQSVCLIVKHQNKLLADTMQ